MAATKRSTISGATFVSHLLELRDRLLRALGAVLVVFIIAAPFANDLYEILAAPLMSALPEGNSMISTQPHGPFFVPFKFAFAFAVAVAMPYLLYQLWSFVAPGLYKNERRAFLPFLMATPVLFLMGASLVYYLIFPLAWQFFMSFESAGGPGTLAIVMEPKVNEYLALVMKLIFAFGLSFQLPVVLMLMARAGLVSSKGLAEKRKYAVVITFAAAALLTPPDIISQIGLGIPILLLYEISILGTKLVEKKRAQREAAEDAEE